MKTRSEVSPEKLRGGFYTPLPLAVHAVERLRQLVGHRSELRVLEPSIGDGAFLDPLASSALCIAEVVGVEIIGEEASKASRRLVSSGLAGHVVNASTLRWSLDATPSYDAVVGNLPFVRFQFVSDTDRADAARHGVELGVNIGGVSNLWLPMLLASLRMLRIGGVFVLVLPAECLTGVSAGSARRWLLENVSDLRCDLYPAGSFPGALQEVVLLSGRIEESTPPNPSLEVALHTKLHSSRTFLASSVVVNEHSIPVGSASWTRYLLTHIQIDALHEFAALPGVHELQNIAKFEVSTVTGANAFFSLSPSVVRKYGLELWARPLLPRARHAPGLIFDAGDHASLVDDDRLAYLFDGAMSDTVRDRHSGLDHFLAEGEAQDLHLRFKCRIRSPWWAIPNIRRGELLLSKRCNRFPRMILNDTEAVTTDTIYRGRIVSTTASSLALVAGFHNSGTLLSSELEGRNFGGGVLELVPSEVARLKVPVVEKMQEEIERLDRISRETADAKNAEKSELLIQETDLLLCKYGIGMNGKLMDILADARSLLLDRRLDRTATRE